MEYFGNEDLLALMSSEGVPVALGGVLTMGIIDRFGTRLRGAPLATLVGKIVIVSIATGALPGLANGAEIAFDGETRLVKDHRRVGDGAVTRIWTAKIEPETDVVPPGAVADLAIAFGWDLPTGTRLTMTAPGDNGAVGLAPFVAARYSTAGPITTEGEWSAAADLFFGGSSDPWKENAIAGGSPKQFEVTANPAPGVPKFVAVRFKDDAGNVGGISNVVVWQGGGD